MSLSAWDNLSSDHDDQHIELDWGEMKTCHQYLMTLHPDASDWVLDSFHALACYLLAGPSSYRSAAAKADVNYLFPAYTDLADASSKVSRIIDKCRKSKDNTNGVEGIPLEAISHSLRVSSFNTALMHPGVPWSMDLHIYTALSTHFRT